MKNNFPHALWWLVILCTGCIQQAPQSFVQRTVQEDTGLRFLVSADPQYHWKDMLDGSSSVINADQVAVWSRFQYQATVATAPHRGIQVPAPGFGSQSRDRLLRQNGDVYKGRFIHAIQLCH